MSAWPASSACQPSQAGSAQPAQSSQPSRKLRQPAQRHRPAQILPLLTADSLWVGGTPQLPRAQVACSAPAVTPRRWEEGKEGGSKNSNPPKQATGTKVPSPSGRRPQACQVKQTRQQPRRLNPPHCLGSMAIKEIMNRLKLTLVSSIIQ